MKDFIVAAWQSCDSNNKRAIDSAQMKAILLLDIVVTRFTNHLDQRCSSDPDMTNLAGGQVID